MVPDLTLEVIYLDQPTDFKMEFELCGSSNVRFLSVPVKSRSEFLGAMSKSVVRSRAIIIVGSFNPLDKLYVPKIVAKAVGYELKKVENEKFGIASNEPVFLPETALPLVDPNGNLGGCVLENNDQSIIMLTSVRDLRHYIVTNLVCPYLKLFANKNTKPFNIVPQKNNIKMPAVAPSVPPIIGAEAKPLNIPAVEPDVEPSVVTEMAPEGASAAAEPDLSAITNPPVTPAVSVEVATDVSPAEDETTVETAETVITDENADIPTPVLSAATVVPAIIDTPETKEEPALEAKQYEVLEQPDILSGSGVNLEEFLSGGKQPPNNGKPKKSKKLIKAIISVVLVLAVLIASYLGYDLIFQPMQSDSVYKEVRELYGQTWDGLPEDMLNKFGMLYKTNSDIYGWLSVPNTNINLPVVNSAKKTAKYYNSHLFEGSLNRYGTLYTSSKLIKDGYHKNVVIYGKNTGDGSMLSELNKFLNIEQYKEAPTFTFDSLYVENKWKIFSVFKVNKKSTNKYSKTKFADDTEFSEYLKKLENTSVIDTNIDVTYSDHIITLISKGDETDIVLVARRVRDGESPMVDITGATENYSDGNSAEDSDLPVVANPLTLIEPSDEANEEVETEDPSMADGATSRYEQQAPVTSTIPIKPTMPTIPSVSSTSSSSSESKNSSVITSSKDSSKPSSTSAPSSNTKPSSNTTTTSSQKNESVSSGSSGTIPNKLPILTVTNAFNNAKVTGNAVEIVAQNIEAEMGQGYEIEALKAQAVAAYSWLLTNGAEEGKYPVLPLKKASAKCLKVAQEVAGQVAVYDGKVAATYYYAISAGRSAYSQDIWSSAVPYLVSVISDVDESVSGFKTVRKYSADTVAKIAEDLLKIDLKSINDKNKWFSCTYDVNGVYCTKIKIGSVERKGTFMRDTFFHSTRVGASNVLRSSAYTISYDSKSDSFIFTVKGYGHGVGMSQTGANMYAKKGWSYEKILKHYYTGITIGAYYGKN